ncbi:MAG: TonB-dependent receptor [Bacteroidota bacterium]
MITLEGKVSDNEGKPVYLVNVIVRNDEAAIRRGAATDENGNFWIFGIPPGTYTVQAQHVGYKPTVRENIQFVTGQRPILNLILTPEVIQHPVVEVVGTSIQEFELRRLDVSTAVLREQIMSLPLNSRNVLGLASLAPGIRSYAPAAGRSTTSAGVLPNRFINFYVDGAEWKSVFTGGIVGFPETGSPIPQDAIQEFRVILGAYDAEFSRGGAWMINALTRRGTNVFHFEGFSFFRDKAFNAKGPFEKTKPEYNRQQVGMTVGGPIVQDKFFFFGSYELHNANDFFDVIPGRPGYDPGLWDRYRGTFKAPSRNHTGVARLTYQESTDHTFDYIWSTRNYSSITEFGGTAAEPSAILNDFHTNSHLLKHMWIISSRSSNELGFHHLRWRHAQSQKYPGPTLVRPSIRLGRSFIYPQRLVEDQYRVTEKFTTQVEDFYGPHLLKTGFDILLVRMEGWFPNFLFPQFTFATDTSSLPNEARIGVGLLHPLDPNGIDAEVEIQGTVIGFYVQDEWKVTSRLTLNLGMRYDAEINTLGNTQGVAWADSADLVNLLPAAWIQKGDRKNDLDNIAPRFSFTYDAFGSGQTILRGGYGIMYDRTASILAYVERRGALWRTYRIPNPGTLDPAVLRQRVAAGGVPPPVDLLDQNIESPKVQQFFFGIGHQFSEELAVNVDYIHQRAMNLYANVFNVNYLKPSTQQRVLSQKYGDINISMSIGDAFFHGILTNLTYRTQNLRLSASYTLSWAESEFDLFQPLEFSDQASLRMQRSNADERHRLVLSGSSLLPFGIQISGLATIATPRAYDVRDGRDLNDNNTLGDDWPDGIRTQVPSITFDNCYKMVDLRISKNVEFAPVRLEFIFEVFNLFNWFNASSYPPAKFDRAGNALLSFGQPNAAYEPRQMQIGLRVSF